MWSMLRTVGLVTMITILIWLWAEAEVLRRTTVTPRIVFADQAGDLVVEIKDPNWRADSVQLRLEGPNVAIDEAERVMRSPIELTPGIAGVPSEPGEHTLRIADLIRAQPEISRTGVTITDAQPSTVTIEIARLVTRELPIRPDLAGIEVEGDVTLSQQTVKVRMPEAAAALIGDRSTVGGGAAGAPAVIAVLSEDERRQLRDDGPQTRTADILLPEVLRDVEHVTVTPEHVRMTLRVRKQTDEVVVPSVPVWITLPNTEGDAWDIKVLDPLIRNVTVRGPTDLIARVRSREILPIASVILSSDDLEEGVTSKQAYFAPVWASQIGAVGPGFDTAAQPDAAMQEQVAPLRFSAENRRVGLEIKRRRPVTDAAPLAPGP